jgi:origin recognition complex subunit 4
VFGSFSDSFEFLLKSFRQGDQESKPLVFIMDEFDLFTKNKTQLLLYTLLNTIQSAPTPICLIGATCRIDVLDLLEKRIKSRFSHRQVYLFNDYDFESYCHVGKHFFYSSALVNGASGKKKQLENFLDTLFKNKQVMKLLARQYEYDKSIASLKRLTILPSVKLNFLYENGLLNETGYMEVVVNELTYSYELLNLDSKLLVLSGLSILELTLIVVILDVTQTFVDEPFNFDIVYNSYLKFLSKQHSGQQKHERQIVLKVRSCLFAPIGFHIWPH